MRNNLRRKLHVCKCISVHRCVNVCGNNILRLHVTVHESRASLLFASHLSHLVVHRSLPGEQVSGVSASEAGLDVEHGHVLPAGGVVVGGRSGAGGAGFVLDELEERLHVGA